MVRFKMAIESSLPSNTYHNYPLSMVGVILMVLGNILVITSTYQLGIMGTYLGDYFGFLMKERVTGFPFNIVEHPMYDGATMIFLGYSLWYSLSLKGS